MGEFKRDFKMKVKILFLDIDGVLNSKLYYKYIYKPENGWSRFDPYCVVLIKRLIEEFSLRIVITSTWRNGIVDRLMRELEENDLVYHLHKDWHTPIIRPANRGIEIKLWLDDHPEATEFLIIDDNENLLEYQMNRFVKTNNYAGMAQEHYNQARNILLSEKEYLMLPNLVIEQ
ncbi:MAG: hypothetical protein A2W30_08070 [Ignavibacteria bacterium RBG_16_36_9]|jgi:hypothetical protein|nr:MAG: hypothetical protein A2W30_08070 [Ignavibacteria bacterium RBG_16_36_9]